MIWARKITTVMAIAFLLIYFVFGSKIQSLCFFVLGFLTFIFTLICYYYFIKIKGVVARLFLIGSFSYSLMAILSFFAGFSFGGYQGFIDKFDAHPTVFMYSGSLLEAVVFSILIGNRISILEREKKESLQRIDELKSIVIKNHIVLKDKTKVYISDLLYVKADDHYLHIFTSNGKSHFVRGKLGKIKEELPPNFVQCHRSYIVNCNFIKRINSNHIILTGNINVPLSRSFKNKF